jgi:hypothetical protein
MPVIIREYAAVKRGPKGCELPILEGALATDETGVAIKTVNPTGVAADAAALQAGTEFVVLENTGEDTVRFAVRPKGKTVAVPATASHPRILPGEEVLVAVYSKAIISFIEIAAP